MYLRKCTNKKTGRTQLTIVRGYRDQNGKSKQKTILPLGYVDVLKNEYDDPIAHFEEVARRMSEDLKQKTAPLNITLAMGESLDGNCNLMKNFGYIIFSILYHDLDIDAFIQKQQTSVHVSFNHNSIFRFLVYTKLICPGTRKSSYEFRHLFFDRTDFTLNDVFLSLTLFAEQKENLQLWLHSRIMKMNDRDTSLAYFIITNNYFEFDTQSNFSYTEFSEERSSESIVQLGLFMDPSGIPISYGLFPVSTPGTKTSINFIQQAAANYALKRTVFVSNRGAAHGNDIAQILVDNNGYIMGHSVREADQSFRDYVLDPHGYQPSAVSADAYWTRYRCSAPKHTKSSLKNIHNPGETKDPAFRMKTRICHRTMNIITADGRKRNITVEEKQIVYYSPLFAKKAKSDRAEAIVKARDAVAHPEKYTRHTIKSAVRFIKNIAFDAKTGEISDNVKRKMVFDESKLQEEEKYDGYFAIVSSELHESSSRILELYKTIQDVEESFRMKRHELFTKPESVPLTEHIEAHFLICFVSILFARLLQKKMDNKYSVDALLNSIRKATCSMLCENLYTFHYCDPILKDIGEVFNISFDRKYRTRAEIKHILSKSRDKKSRETDEK